MQIKNVVIKLKGKRGDFKFSELFLMLSWNPFS